VLLCFFSNNTQVLVQSTLYHKASAKGRENSKQSKKKSEIIIITIIIINEWKRDGTLADVQLFYRHPFQQEPP